MTHVTVKTLKDLDRFAALFAKTLRGGDVVGLIGDLGAGKTTFVQRLSAALGIKKPVRSPTFILMQLFNLPVATAKKVRFRQVCHIDAYRLEKESELMAIGFADYAGAPDTVTLVEWAEKMPGVNRFGRYREIRISFGKKGERVFEEE
ncbi:MAG: tRNA (adenosine(37)-N6)-threonylcarbamoyltransferase complex ATPase subunit type 1 TsaE [Patescibacteria group bacterium]|nr:tRNA (adenosine(37)-N6)-threonylcarbamoyltransferase complex ATPase subunit type 1 TsaE [Patescibacteria group bacterium]